MPSAPPAPSGPSAPARTRLRRLLRDSVAPVRRHDVPLYAAGLTFYGGIALLPSALLAIYLAGIGLGRERTDRLGMRLADSLPDELGADGVAARLVEAGADLGWVVALVAVVPATLYGEGLRRAFARLEDVDESLTGWRGRLGVLPLLLATPLVAAGLLVAAPLFDRLTDDGVWSGALAVYLGLCLDWLLLTLPVTYIYRVLMPERPPWRAAFVAGTTVAAFVAGFLQGFVLFLSLPLDLGLPFGGFQAVGAVVAVALWLWVLHLLVLVGHGMCRELSRSWGGRAAGTA